MQYHYKQKGPTNNIKTQFRKQSHVFCGLSSRLIQMLLRQSMVWNKSQHFLLYFFSKSMHFKNNYFKIIFKQ